MNQLAELLRGECLRRINESRSKINTALEKLSEDEVWYRPNAESNSMGNILLHLCGNLTQYVLSSIGGQEDHRKRSQEFTEQGPIPKLELAGSFNKVVNEVCHLISKMDEAELEKKRPVQCYEESGVGILLHVTEHLSYHTGQIVYFTKWKRAESMHFYDERALEAHGE